MSTIHDKLVAIQSGLKAPKDQTNAFGKYKYRSCEDILEAVKPLLKEHKLVLTLSDDIVEVGGRVYVKACAMLGDGENTVPVFAFAREQEAKLNKEGRDTMDHAQITGAASSYARKYALNGLFCIDDTKDADTMDNTAPKTVKNIGINTETGDEEIYHTKAAPVIQPVPKKKPTLDQVKKAMSDCKVPHEVETVLASAKKYPWTDAEALQLNEMYKEALNRVLPI